MKLIPADKYKDLLNGTVELCQYKIMNEKLKESLKSKSAEIKRLKRTIRNYEMSSENKIQIRDVEAKKTEDNESRNLSAKVNSSNQCYIYCNISR